MYLFRKWTAWDAFKVKKKKKTPSLLDDGGDLLKTITPILFSYEIHDLFFIHFSDTLSFIMSRVFLHAFINSINDVNHRV